MGEGCKGCRHQAGIAAVRSYRVMQRETPCMIAMVAAQRHELALGSSHPDCDRKESVINPQEWLNVISFLIGVVGAVVAIWQTSETDVRDSPFQLI